MVSLLYKAIVPVVGRPWLDDRFLMFVNCLLAAASLAGFDRILATFGLEGRGQRLIAASCCWQVRIRSSITWPT